MANAPKGGKRLAGNKPAMNFPNTNSGQFTYTGATPNNQSVDDALIDEILRSIAGVDFNVTAAPARTLSEPPKRSALPRSRMDPNQAAAQAAAAAAQPEPAAPVRPAAQPRSNPQGMPNLNNRGAAAYARTGGNEYQAAASTYARQQTQPEEPVQGMRDVSQTQVFRPARPARRDTDRLPTLVDEAPRRKHPVLNRLLTLIVVVLILVALVLGVKMVYILGPSMGWNLPDLSNVPVISQVLGMIPDAEEQPITMPEETQSGVETIENEVPDPTSVSLDTDRLVLKEGETKVLTATLDVENWGGLLAWASSDKNEQVIRLTVLGPNTAQVEYVGEGTCAVAVQVGVKPADGSEAPHATCYIECEGKEEVTEPEEQATEETTEAEHIDISLKKDDFTLNVGESYPLMGEGRDQLSWSSSNESVATVSNGMVAAVGAGTATITATGPDGTTASAICRVR